MGLADVMDSRAPRPRRAHARRLSAPLHRAAWGNRMSPASSRATSFGSRSPKGFTEVSTELAKHYRKLRIDVLTSTCVESIDESGPQVRAAVTGKGGNHRAGCRRASVSSNNAPARRSRRSYQPLRNRAELAPLWWPDARPWRRRGRSCRNRRRTCRRGRRGPRGRRRRCTGAAHRRSARPPRLRG